MYMILEIYKRAFKVLMKKPFVLWGISLLEGFLTFVFTLLFGFALGVGICISMLIGTGMTMVYLHGYRGEEVHCVQLFDCFKDFATIKRVLCGTAWSWLWIFLWALIPIVGPIFAIIRAYRYRLVPYILVTEPDVAPTEAIKVSTERTMGYKGKMFGADVLVVIAYGLLCLVLALLGMIPYLGIVFNIISFIIGLAWSLFSTLYFGLVQAAFYEEITNPTIPAQPVRTNPYANPYAGAYQDPYAGYNAPAGQPSAPAGQASAFCPNCGSPVDPNGMFCPSCGQKIR